MLIAVASLGKITTAFVLAFGGPLRWRTATLGEKDRKHDSSSSASSWSGEEIIHAIRHEARMSSSSSQLFNTDPLLQLPRTSYIGTQALLKKYNVIQQQQTDFNHQQRTMLKGQRQNNDTDIDTGTTTNSLNKDGQQVSSNQQQRQPPPPHKFSRRLTVQVCLSPGCIADGATTTMEKLQALAPAHVRIQQGACSSFCGSGPVVVTVLEEQAPPPASSSSSSSGQRQQPILVEQKSHKRILNDKILQLVYPNNNPPPTDLVQGYDLVLQGDAHFTNMEFSKAMECYQEAVRVAFTSAVELQNKRDRFRSYWAQHHNAEEEEPDSDNDSENVEDISTDMVTDNEKVTTVTTTSKTTTSSSTRIPVELEWLISARRNEARCKLELGNDIEGAVLAAQASCNLSRNTSSESFHVLAEVYKIKQDLMGEMQALQKMLSLPSSSTSSNNSAAAAVSRSQRQQQFAMENQRRIAGIRLQKLERELQSQIKRP